MCGTETQPCSGLRFIAVEVLSSPGTDNPEGGCSDQPKVAVLSYLGKRGPEWFQP